MFSVGEQWYFDGFISQLVAVPAPRVTPKCQEIYQE